MRWGRCGVFVAGAVASALQWQAEARAQSVQLPAIVVTSSGRVEPRPSTPAAGTSPAITDTQPIYVTTPTGRTESISRVVGTTQIIGREAIERSTARSVAELMAENAVGFLSEWTPGQTSLNIRGAATEGQGRDFRSQVLVLINGHRAGTANISKLSIADLDRIEIVRGPSSVVYGSQNMGGVVNLIMKTGLSAPGSFLDASTGSWGLGQGKLQHGGVKQGSTITSVFRAAAATISTSAAARTKKTPRGTDAVHRRRSASRSTTTNRVDLNMRTDGIYDAGFRGSSSNVYAFDDRTNQSYDLTYTGRLPDGRANWFFQHYGVIDIDDLNNPNPFNIGTTRTSIDHNSRTQYILGTRVQPRVNLWQGNDLLVGWDWEQSRLRSDRTMVGLNGAAVVQRTPFDNNQTEDVNAFYFEDSQTLFDRWILRGGVRRTFGETTFEPTPFQAPPPGGRKYALTTYSAGTAYQALDWLSFRLGTSTGFRAPTATDLSAGSTITFTGNTIFGNPSLRPETSKQVEIGHNAHLESLAARPGGLPEHHQRSHHDHGARGPPTISDTINNPGDIVVRGVEFQAETDLMRTFRVARPGPWRWSRIRQRLLQLRHGG